MKKKTSKSKKTMKTEKSFTAQNKKRPVESESHESGDIIDLILRDHKPIKELILVLKDPEVKIIQKRPAFEEFETILSGHAAAEEESLYVHMKKVDELRMEALEGDVEHALAVQLMEEIGHIKGDEYAWLAKVKVLAELVDHHVKEEEKQFLKDVRKQIDVATRIEIGTEYLQLLSQLKKDGNGTAKTSNQSQARVMHA